MKSKRWFRRNRRNKELIDLLRFCRDDQYVTYSPSYKRLAIKTRGQPQSFWFFTYGWGKPVDGDEFKRYRKSNDLIKITRL
jgi:hypothetical protein